MWTEISPLISYASNLVNPSYPTQNSYGSALKALVEYDFLDDDQESPNTSDILDDEGRGARGHWSDWDVVMDSPIYAQNLVQNPLLSANIQLLEKSRMHNSALGLTTNSKGSRRVLSNCQPPHTELKVEKIQLFLLHVVSMVTVPPLGY